MSNESPRKLTQNDPVEPAMLDRLGELEQARNQLGGQLIDLEQERIKVLRAAGQIDEQRVRLFEKILMDRGLPPGTVAEVDAATGKLIVHRVPAQPGQTASVNHSPRPPEAASAPPAPPAPPTQ